MSPDEHHEWNAVSSDWGGDERDADVEPVGTVRIGRLDELYVTEDDETGISSQGPTKAAALRNLAENLEVYEEGEESTDDWL